MNTANLIAAMNAVDNAERAVHQQGVVLRRELAAWYAKVEALQATIGSARLLMETNGFGEPIKKPRGYYMRTGERILTVLEDGPCDLGSLTQRVYGASTPTERCRATSFLNHLRKKGAVESAGRGVWRLTKKETP